MFKAVTSLLSSNSAIKSLKDEKLHKAYKDFRGNYAKNSEIEVLEKTVKNSATLEDFEKAHGERAAKVAERIAKSEDGSIKEEVAKARDGIVRKTSKEFEGANEDDFQKLRGVFNSKEYKKARKEELAKDIAPYSKELVKAGKGYFASGDMKTNAMRYGAVAGAYGVGAVGTRYMSGGTATTNNRGERDIAGIPFF